MENLNKNTTNTYLIEVGDKVRFICYKNDEDGFTTDKVMRVTGRVIAIEQKHIDSPYFPKIYVRRNGLDYWYFGNNIELLEKGKRPRKYNVL